MALGAAVAAAALAGGCKKRASEQRPPVPVAALAAIPADASVVVGLDVAQLAQAAVVARAVDQMLVRDPERVAGPVRGSILDLLRMPALWPILPIAATNYLPLGALRGLWVGPYYADVFGEGPAGIGLVALVMGLAMVAGNFAYGPADRWLGTRKWLNFTGNAVTAAALVMLALLPPDWWTGVVLLAVIGFFGASFAMVIAHGRAFFPPHLVGRGVTLLNLFALGSVGLAQFATGRLFTAIPPEPAQAPYTAIFWFFAIALVAGLIPYLFARDRTD